MIGCGMRGHVFLICGVALWMACDDGATEKAACEAAQRELRAERRELRGMEMSEFSARSTVEELRTQVMQAHDSVQSAKENARRRDPKDDGELPLLEEQLRRAESRASEVEAELARANRQFELETEKLQHQRSVVEKAVAAEATVCPDSAK